MLINRTSFRSASHLPERLRFIPIDTLIEFVLPHIVVPELIVERHADQFFPHLFVPRLHDVPDSYTLDAQYDNPNFSVKKSKLRPVLPLQTYRKYVLPIVSHWFRSQDADIRLNLFKWIDCYIAYFPRSSFYDFVLPEVCPRKIYFSYIYSLSSHVHMTASIFIKRIDRQNVENP